jgi:hypothetical protein
MKTVMKKRMKISMMKTLLYDSRCVSICDKKYKLYRDFNPVLMTNYMTRNTNYTEISTLY